MAIITAVGARSIMAHIAAVGRVTKLRAVGDITVGVITTLVYRALVCIGNSNSRCCGGNNSRVLGFHVALIFSLQCLCFFRCLYSSNIGLQVCILLCFLHLTGNKLVVELIHVAFR